MAGWAKPGVKCVCVDHSDIFNPNLAIVPPMGERHMIKGVLDDYLGRGTTLLIEGYPNVSLRLGHDMGWAIWRFRPLITRTQQQDLAIFTPLLSGINRRIEA
jgi:hypothetical protein